ncbi:MAG: ABC transporter ATP-binding protein [Desulfobacterales bacterium]|nr:ABC transporter ATP-binding protein [Desulfobacterales bacterium]
MKKDAIKEKPGPNRPPGRAWVFRNLWQLLASRKALLAGQAAASVLLVATEGLAAAVFLLFTGMAGRPLDLAPFPVLAGLGMESLAPGTRVYLVAAALLLILWLRAAVMYIQQILSVKLRLSVEVKIQEEIFSQWLRRRPDTLQEKRTGDLLTLPGRFSMQIGQLVLSVGAAVSGVIVFFFYTMVALAVSWPLTLMGAILLIAISQGLHPMLTRRIKRAGARSKDAIRGMSATSQEFLSGMKTIHLFNREDWSRARFHQALGLYKEKKYQSDRITLLVRPLFGALTALAVGILLIVNVVWAPGSEEARLVQLGVFLGIALRLMKPAAQLSQFQALVVQNGPVLRTVLDFLNREDQASPPDGSIIFDGLRQGVVLDNVTFRYAPGEPAALEEASLHIPGGRVTAVVGPSGAGKSTMVDLITRVYDPTRGEIRVDGRSLRDLALGSWRSRVAVVSQDVFMFHDTAMENLLFARPDAPAGEVHRAARLARADEFIRRLPRGYHTNLRDRGVRLSGGQRQRIAIARALLVDADLLILDEATSELDPPTERALREALETYREKCAILVIAHRQSTIARADHIYVLEGGRIVEHGAHDELMRENGAYRNLFQADDSFAMDN